MYMEKWWDTTTLDEFFGITEGSRCMLVDTTPVRNHGSKHAHNKGEEYPQFRKKGRLIKDGVIYEVDGVMKFAKEHGLHPNGSGVSRVLNGKRKSYRGFRLA